MQEGVLSLTLYVQYTYPIVPTHAEDLPLLLLQGLFALQYHWTKTKSVGTNLN